MSVRTQAIRRWRDRPAAPASGARFALAARELGRDGPAVLAFAALGGIALAALLAPIVAPYDPVAVSSMRLEGPSLSHPFGTDQLGRDVLSRVIWGGRPILLAASIGVGIAGGLGTVLGIIAGYRPGVLRTLIMRGIDILLALPGLLLALAIVAILGPGLMKVALAVGVSFVPHFARSVYIATLSEMPRDYIRAARASGGKARYVIRRHVVPNVSPQILVIASSAFGWAVLVAGTLNFLGFGVRLPTADWGADLASGGDFLSVAWWISLFPGMAITVAILATNTLGDALNTVVGSGKVATGGGRRETPL